MKVKKQILRTLILFIGIVVIYNIKTYCTVDGTKRMEITGGTPWTSINITNAYKECESLNSTTSTLGTNNLSAHLTTDEDWSAMAIFSISQYGGATNNSPTITTGNSNPTGVYNPGRKYTFTTGILNTATKNNANNNVKGLFNDEGGLKYSYTKQWSPTRAENNFVGFKTLAEGGTYGWYGGWQYWGNNASYPISVKQGLFGVGIGNNGYGGFGGADRKYYI